VTAFGILSASMLSTCSTKGSDQAIHWSTKGQVVRLSDLAWSHLSVEPAEPLVIAENYEVFQAPWAAAMW